MGALMGTESCPTVKIFAYLRNRRNIRAFMHLLGRCDFVKE